MVTPLSTIWNNYIHSILLAYYVFKLNRRAFQNNYSMVWSFFLFSTLAIARVCNDRKTSSHTKLFPECWKRCLFLKILLFAFWTYIIPLLCITKKNIRPCWMRGMTNIETNEHKTYTFFLSSIRQIELLIPILQKIGLGKIRFLCNVHLQEIY